MEKLNEDLVLQLKIGEIRNDDFSLYTYFLSQGINNQDVADLNLEQLCERFDLNTEMVVSRMGEDKDSFLEDYIDFSRLSSTHIIDYLLKTHHDFIINAIPEILREGNMLKETFDVLPENLNLAIELFEDMATELLEHIKEEEEKIFPVMRKMDEEEQEQVSSLMNDVEIEHEEASGSLKELNRLTDGFNAPEKESQIELYYNMLHDFSDKLYAHIHIETSVLFPRYNTSA